MLLVLSVLLVLLLVVVLLLLHVLLVLLVLSLWPVVVIHCVFVFWVLPVIVVVAMHVFRYCCFCCCLLLMLFGLYLRRTQHVLQNACPQLAQCRRRRKSENFLLHKLHLVSSLFALSTGLMPLICLAKAAVLPPRDSCPRHFSASSTKCCSSPSASSAYELMGKASPTYKRPFRSPL
jgi:hypothetical protein